MTKEELPQVYVVLAVYRPDVPHLEAQIASIAAQTLPVDRLVAVIADRTSAALVGDIASRHGLATEIVIPEAETASYQSFETGLARALEIAPQNAVFALCDQDDEWAPTRIAASLEAMTPGVHLTHSDAEVIDADGARLHRSLHRLERRKRRPSLRDLLLKNVYTGMTMTLSRRLAEASLPFPRQSALFFHHDLWIGLVAPVLGGVRCIDRPLVRYRQHGGNVVGAVAAPVAAPGIATPAWKRHWAGRYAVASYLAKRLYLRASEIVAAGDPTPDRRELARLSPYLRPRPTGLRLMADAARLFALGQGRLARDSAMFALVQAARLAHGLRDALRSGLFTSLSDFDRRLFSMAPGVLPDLAPVPEAPEPEPQSASDFADRRTRRRFDVRMADTADTRMVIFVPTLNPAEIFAGIATALDIGIGLAERGTEVMFVATDLPIASHQRSLEFVLRRGALRSAAVARRVTLACGQTSDQLTFASSDRLMATAWWTAHIAQDLIDRFPFYERQFFYLIQDFEPGFYPWGHEYAGARASYDFDHVPVFNSDSLRRFFVAEGLVPETHDAMCFRPAIDLARYTGVPRRRNTVPKLAVYGRPEVARNLFPVCISALEQFLADAEIAPDAIDLVSVGMAHGPIRFASGHVLTSLGKIPWDEYPDFLGGVDIGLSLMLSPHPSHPPLEMAAAGARVVTNTFVGKDLGRASTAILSVDPTVPNVAEALGAAWRRGAVNLQERRIELAALGRPLDLVIDEIADRVAPCDRKFARAG